ncbi:MAG: precorrin-8X methylmutase [Chloroflexi bacterium]|nr:precorrin-8X methylmutase [Chloroflexota bacterium]
MKTGVIVIAHGSRGDKGAAEVAEALRRLSHGVRAFLPADVEVTGAALQFNHPTLDEAVRSLAEQGVTRLVIVPYFLFPGRHITEHIPCLIEELKSTYPQHHFMLAGNLGLDEYLVDLVAKRILEAAPELLSDGQTPSPSPGAIEQQSMALIDKLLPPLNISEGELAVVKRMVHTAGDRHLASLVRFHPAATEAALSAIRSGRPIFTDVKMVAVAINRRLAARFGCSIYCALDEMASARTVQEKEDTRTATAFRLLGQRLNGSIAVVGNSPTALLALLEMVSQRKVIPAMVIGTPVGFVQAKEVKEKLMGLDIPYISIAGTRGGSALAAAAVNALMKLAEAERSPVSTTGVESNL